MKHSQIITLLQKVAESVEPVSRARLASCLVYKNEIISIGINRAKTHPFQKRFSSHEEAIFLHSENDAIYNALKRYDLETVSKSRLYVCRVKYADESKAFMVPAMAKPCMGCQRAIAQFNIKHVCYTTEEGLEWL